MCDCKIIGSCFKFKILSLLYILFLVCGVVVVGFVVGLIGSIVLLGWMILGGISEDGVISWIVVGVVNFIFRYKVFYLIIGKKK